MFHGAVTLHLLSRADRLSALYTGKDGACSCRQGGQNWPTATWLRLFSVHHPTMEGRKYGSPISSARAGEYLYIIQSTNLSGLPIYTKGKLVKEADLETYYFLVSSKRAL